jgi:predicted RNase H-like nuclease
MSGRYLGVDGCRSGWFAVALAGSDAWRTGLHPTLADLSAAFPDAALILIDIPLGLPSQGPRRCDREARKLLGRGFASSIFPTPCREALTAADYPAACDINREILGMRLSRQTYHIMPKIREADQWRRAAGRHGAAIRESHPELAFRALAGGQALEYKKKTVQGKAERLALLARHFPPAQVLFEQARREHRKRDLADDDILDALGLAVTGWISRGRLDRVPEHSETDGMGLPMEIVFGRIEPAPELTAGFDRDGPPPARPTQ